MKTIVILVDNKRRDLPGAALIAHQLKKVGVRCELEPLGAWRSVLWAHKPDMIIFNHLNAAHLESYSQELHRRGVLTAVLPNEGIFYDEVDMEFNAAKFHNNGHIDYFFCWNHVHANAVKRTRKKTDAESHVIGIPRFDFYFPPLAKTFPEATRKKVLICTNFIFAKFNDLPSSVGERFFGRWSDAVPAYKNWRTFVAMDHEARLQFFDFLNAAVRQTDHEIILRPHPNGNPAPFDAWYKSLSSNTKERVRYDREGNIADLILECDLEVARDTCTTTMEAWIAGKPTLDIHLTDHPVFHQDFTEKLTPVCDQPEHFPRMIDDLLKNGEPERFNEPRKEHLQKWCNTPDGRVCERFAALLKGIVEAQPAPDFSHISFSDVRRGARLKALKAIGLPCTYKPFLSLKYLFNPRKGFGKKKAYEKTIKPSDVKQWMAKFEHPEAS